MQGKEDTGQQWHSSHTSQDTGATGTARELVENSKAASRAEY